MTKKHDRYVQKTEVMHRTGMSPIDLNEAVKAGTFPQPFHHHLWLNSDVTEWENNQRQR